MTGNSASSTKPRTAVRMDDSVVIAPAQIPAKTNARNSWWSTLSLGNRKNPPIPQAVPEARLVTMARRYQ